MRLENADERSGHAGSVSASIVKDVKRGAEYRDLQYNVGLGQGRHFSFLQGGGAKF